MENFSERVVLDFDGYVNELPEDQRARVSYALGRVPEHQREQAKQKMIGVAVVSEAMGFDSQKANRDWPVARRAYALQRGWTAEQNDDGLFHAKLKEEKVAQKDERFLVDGPDEPPAPAGVPKWRALKEKGARNLDRAQSLVGLAEEEAFKGGSYASAFLAWQEKAKGKPGYDPAKESIYADIAANVHGPLAATITKVQPLAAQAFDLMQKGRGVKEGEGDIAPVALFRDMDPAERAVAFKLMRREIKATKSDKNGGQAFMEAIGRGYENWAVGGNMAAKLEYLQRLKFKAGDTVTEADPLEEANENFRAEFADSLNVGGAEQTLAREIRRGIKGKALTAEQAKEWNDKIAGARKDIETIEQLRRFSQNEVDPVRSGSGAFDTFVMPLAESAAVMTTLMVPGIAAPAVGAQSYAMDEYLANREKGMDEGQAMKLAQVSGHAQALLDKVQLSILAKGIPGTQKALQRAALAGTVGERFVSRTLSTTAAETIIELTQDFIVPAMAQDILTSNPQWDVKWATDVWPKVADAAPEMAAGMILLSGMGAIGQVRSESKYIRELSSSRASMMVSGYTSEQIDQIVAAPMETRGDLLAQFLPSEAPKPTKEFIAAVKFEALKEAAAARIKLDAETAAGREAATEAISVTRRGSGWWIETPDHSQQVDSAEAARQIRDSLKQASTEAEANALVGLIDQWTAAAPEGAAREVKLTGEEAISNGQGVLRSRNKFLDFYEDGSFSEEAMEEMRREGAMVGAGDWFGINGSNQFRRQVVNGASQLVQAIELNRSDSSVFTFLHEAVEAEFRRTGSDKAAQTSIAAMRASFDPSKVRDEATRLLFERVQKVADGNASATELRETFSELAVADVLGRSKDGSLLPAGSISSALDAAIRDAVDAKTAKEIGKVRAFFRAVKAYFRALFATVSALRKAKKSGTGQEFESLVSKLLGIQEQETYDESLSEEVGEYVEPTEEEQAAGIAFSLSKLTARFANRGVKIEAKEDKRGITLSNVEVREGIRGNGMGSEAMRELTAYADRSGKPMVLGKNEAPDFFARFGFEDGKRSPGVPAFSLSKVTDSASFKKWFAESKVVDKKGAPVVVYHGVGKAVEFDTFKGESAAGWFSEKKGLAQARYGGGGKVIETYLSIQNPLDLTKRKGFDMDANGSASSVYREAGLPEPMNAKYRYGGRVYDTVNSREFVEIAKAAGYDGIKVRENNTLTWAAFDPAQIKSTTNNGDFNPEDPRFNFSISAGSRLELTMKRLDAALARDPAKRRELARQANDKLQSLAFNWEQERWTPKGDEIRPLVEKKNAEQIEKERVRFEEQRREELEAEVYGLRAEVFGNAEKASIWGGPVMSHLQKSGSTLHGRIRSKASAMKSEWFEQTSGDYDGVDGVPSVVFGGSLMPDQAAQELYDDGLIREPSADAMWDAIRKEVAESERWKQFLKDAKNELRAARERAKAEAKAWKEDQEQKQAKDWSPKARLIRDLRTLDAILSVMPAEVRGKVGGFVKLAQLGTDKARAEEIGRRIEKLGALVESHLQKESTEALTELLAKAEPDREGGKKSKGKLGADVHRYFDEVSRVYVMTEAEVEAERAAIAALYAAPGLTDEQAVDLFEREQILDTFGNWSEKSAADMDSAVTGAQAVYDEGRNRWRLIEEARLGEVRNMAAQLVAAMGGESYAGSQAQKAAGKLGFLRKISLDLKSFAEVLDSLLGANHPLAQRWTQAAREGFQNRNDEVRAARKRWKEALESATGERGVKARRVLWEMARKQTIKVENAGKSAGSTVDVPISLVELWRDGLADPSALGYSADEAARLIAEREAMAPDDRRQNLTLSRAGRELGESVPMSQAEGVFLTMLSAQEQYADALEKAGWTAEAVQSVEDQLMEQAKKLRTFMQAEYRDGYAPLAAQFESMFGVALPQIKNYAPAAFYHTGTEKEMSPEGGIAEGGMRSGFLKNRKRHVAAPKLENAFATFFGHQAQTAHWKGLAPFVRELSGVLGKPEVKRAIEAKHGPEMLKTLTDWQKNLEGNGLQVQAGLADKVVSWITSAQAYIALAYKVGTLVKQSSALLGAAFRMPLGAYARGLGRLLSGQLETAKVFNSPAIQRRLETGFAPEVRAAMADVWNAKPTMRQAFLERGMELIGWTDAFFTTGSAAIAYDYHLRQAKAAGLTDAGAEVEAMRQVEDIVSRTAQPADVVNRSLFEARQGAFGRLLFLFASEARQKSSLWLTAWGNTLTGKATKADARVLALSHFVLAPMMATITAAWRDMRDDDDDEIFDAENWDPLDFFKAIVAGPLSGIPLIGESLSGFRSDGVLGRFVKAPGRLVDVIQGPEENEAEPAEWYLDRIAKLMQAADAFTGVAGSIADQLGSIADNFAPDSEEEQEKKDRAAARRESREAGQ